jgi:hypothetical protein
VAFVVRCKICFANEKQNNFSQLAESPWKPVANMLKILLNDMQKIVFVSALNKRYSKVMNR